MKDAHSVLTNRKKHIMKLPTNTDWLPSTVAQEKVEVSRRSLDNLKNAGVIRTKGSQVLAEDVAMLRDWKARKTYVSGKNNIDLTAPIGFAVPLTDPDLSPGLELSQSNGHAQALTHLQEQERSVGPGQILAGWWSCSDEMSERLVDDRAPLLGVTGGFVVAGGWVEHLAAVTIPRNRKAFLISLMSEAELEGFRGFVPAINQSGTFISLQ